MWDQLAQLRGLTAACVDAPTWPLTDSALVDALDAVHAAEQALASVKLHLVREVDGRGLAVAEHASSTAVWLRERLHVSIHTGKRLVDLARHVDEHPELDAALATGVVNAEQAQVIATVVRDLPGDGEVQAKAEAVLIGQAGQFEPVALRKLGARILAHVAPELADAADAEALRRMEARAQQTRAFTLTPTEDGRTRVTGWLDSEAAAIVNAALDPLCDPKRDAPGQPDRTPAQRRADALVEVCQLALNTDKLPDNGGERPNVVITLPFDLLRQQLGAAMLDSGERLSAEQARRLACDAKIIPAVLGGDGQVLDLGRSRRLFTGPLRRALLMRDGGCCFPGCDRKPHWCQAHHIRPWVDGGPTTLDNAALLCSFHHRLIHHSDWDVRLGSDGLPEFLPPAYIDPQRRPRRNIYHRRT